MEGNGKNQPFKSANVCFLLVLASNDRPLLEPKIFAGKGHMYQIFVVKLSFTNIKTRWTGSFSFKKLRIRQISLTLYSCRLCKARYSKKDTFIGILKTVFLQIGGHHNQFEDNNCFDEVASYSFDR